MFNSAAFIKVLFLAASVLTAQSILTYGAHAQATKVVLVDQNYVVTNSMAFKDINAKTKTLGEQINSELEPQSRALNTERQQLSGLAGGRSQEELTADANYVSAVDAYSRKTARFSEESFISQQELDAAQNAALQKLSVEVKAAIEDVRNENGAHLVLDKAVAASFVDAIDLTQAVLSNLNERAPTINVVLEEFSAEQRDALLLAAAQQQAQEAQLLARQGLAQNRALSAMASAAQREQGAAGN